MLGKREVRKFKIQVSCAQVGKEGLYRVVKNLQPAQIFRLRLTRLQLPFEKYLIHL